MSLNELLISSTTGPAAQQPKPWLSIEVQNLICNGVLTASSQIRAVSTLTATASIPASASGSLLNIASAAAASTYTLPTAAAGLILKFIVTGALSNAVTITSFGGTAIIKGNSYANNAVAVVGPSGTARTNIILGTGSVIGDFVRLTCVDGTNWVANCGVTTNTTLTVS